MRWTILLRREGDTNTSQSSDIPLLSIERDELPAFAQLGLMHREGKSILQNLQSLLLNQQAEEYFARRRRCAKCKKLRTIKYYRQRRLQSLYGVVRLRLPRFNRCDCDPKATPYCWFGSELLPSRTTPEWMAMQAALGARMPYREAAFLLSAFLPADRLRNHGSIRNQTIRVGSRIALEETVAAPNSCPGAVASGSLAIDGTYVRGHGRDGPTKLHVVVGAVNFERRTKSAFAFVQQHKPHRRQLRSMWQRIGCDQSTPLRVVTDGDTGLHNLVKRSFPGTTTHILDWFHIAMRLNAI